MMSNIIKTIMTNFMYITTRPGGLFNALPGAVNTVFCLPLGVPFANLGISIAYRSSFFHDQPFSVSSVTLKQLTANGTLAA